MDTLGKVSTKMQQIAINAERMPQASFTSLSYHLDMEWMYEAYKETRKDGAVGVDGQTAEKFHDELKENLEKLLEQAKSGMYKAPPVRRTYIPKPGSREERPLGIPTFSDKVLQKAVKWLIEPIYETEFYECSYGFRPNRSQHLALKSLWKGLMEMNGGWIIDLDIRKYFDSIKWTYLCDILKQRVRDGVLIRLLGKWMNAGIMEGGEIEFHDKGVPQGAVISPMISNIFLHHVLDEWYEKEVKPRLKGRSFLIRFADDFIIGCEREEDARKVMEVLPKRFNRFNLTIHPEKTTLVDFRKPDTKKDTGSGNGTFDFLGFTHYWGKSRRGYWVIKRKTARKRLKRTISRIWQWFRNNRHEPLKEQYRMLCLKLRGHYQYYGIRGNYRCLELLLWKAIRAWRYWLSRRSSKSYIQWEKFLRILARYPLPAPRIVHCI